MTTTDLGQANTPLTHLPMPSSVAKYLPIINYFETPAMPQGPAKEFQVEKKAVFNRWWEESDMDAEDLPKAATSVIDDWLDEELSAKFVAYGSERFLHALILAFRFKLS